MKRTWREVSFYYPTHNWDVEKVVEGTIVEIKTINVKNKDVDLCIIEKEDGSRISIWRSAGLKWLFSLPLKTYVRVEFRGMQKTKAGNAEFRQFSILYDPETIKEPF